MSFLNTSTRFIALSAVAPLPSRNKSFFTLMSEKISWRDRRKLELWEIHDSSHEKLWLREQFQSPIERKQSVAVKISKSPRVEFISDKILQLFPKHFQFIETATRFRGQLVISFIFRQSFFLTSTSINRSFPLNDSANSVRMKQLLATETNELPPEDVIIVFQ